MSLAHFPPDLMDASSSADEKTSLVFGKRNKRSSRRTNSSDTGIPQVAVQNGQTTTIMPLACIIAAVTLERITYYGILANLVLFMTTDMEFAFEKNTVLLCVFLFTGMAWLMSSVGGFIGDSFSGRYNAIWGSLLIYFYGTFSLSLITYFVDEKPKLQSHPKVSAALIGVTLLIVSIGEGAFKANISAFGADQLLSNTNNTYRRFFNWFYWSINIGSFVAYFLLAWVETEKGFFIGYLIPFCCIALACVTFCIPRTCYVVKPASGNILRKIFGVLREAFRHRKGNNDSSPAYPSLEQFLPIQSWLDRAMIKYGGTYLDSDVEEVKTLSRLSLIFVAQIPYWTIYFQMNSTFLNQGLHMNVKVVEPSGFNVPVAWLSLTDVIFVIFLIPLMDKLVYPWLDRRGWGMSVLTRISIGFVFAVASMMVAGVVESSRSHQSEINNITQTINNQKFIAANMTIMYQVPQYALIGISEVFASVGGLEFAYREAPPAMQSFVMGLFYFVQSIGSLFGAGLYAFSSHVLQWTQESHSNGRMSGPHLGPGPHLDYYFYLLGTIMFVSSVVFAAISARNTGFKRRLKTESQGNLISWTRASSRDASSSTAP